MFCFLFKRLMKIISNPLILNYGFNIALCGPPPPPPQVVQTLDQDHDGELSCGEELRGLSVSTLKALAHIIDPDPANTEEYEYAKFGPQEIR